MPARASMNLAVAFTAEDVYRAYDEWGANCGPGAIAAVLGKTLDEVRPHIPLFDQRRYTNPSMMYSALHSLGARWNMEWDKNWPVFGLARIQWEGPWMNPGVHVAAQWGRTHWVGACARDRRNIRIFDINAIHCGGWVSLDVWKSEIVPEILRHHVPRAGGDWHVTHSINLIGLSR